ncbi:A/G-specific adenine glycosylase [Sphingomonas sp. SUN039]|uniref:A/G-specific adenine glycosylase n=1 Tax=Sphingomonas sp. SUN039 TaxID=2937787 RepID=UPI00216424CF|nr:A/G-specific adenine glycosylase [Sphingomonas sp. SUN039]UVO55798.1 A/G-specific adenine glycosylase [Sphingomonas sp. SUN039]
MSRTSEKLLPWYDANARRLPWRSPPGAPSPDPYRVWLSEIMLQQTTVATVKAYFERFTARWPTVAALAAADEGDVMAAWAGLGYYSRARNLVACARVLAAEGFPADEAGLRGLPGVGPYTAAAIAAIAFGQRAVVVDGNVERVVARLFAVDTPLPGVKPDLKRLAETITPDTRCGDFAQAMMDLGATVCVPRNPRCGDCPLMQDCGAYASGDPGSYPRRAAKALKPERTATAWWIEREGQVLLVRRPAKGLLGGMLALPSTLSAPAKAGAQATAVLPVDWAPAFAGAQVSLGTITHIFTHFRLTMTVAVASLDPGCVLPPGAQWWPLTKLADAGLPTLFAKAAAVAMRERV